MFTCRWKVTTTSETIITSSKPLFYSSKPSNAFDVTIKENTRTTSDNHFQVYMINTNIVQGDL